MVKLVPYVASFYGPVGSEASLNHDIPLEAAAIDPHVRVRICCDRQELADAGAARAISARRCPGIVAQAIRRLLEHHCARQGCGGSLPRPDASLKLIEILGIVEDTEPAANHGLAVGERTIREPEPRSNISPVSVVEAISIGECVGQPQIPVRD